MTTIEFTGLNRNEAEMALPKAFFYKSPKKEAELKFRFNEKGRTQYFARRQQKRKDEGFYIAQGVLKRFDIRFGQMYITGVSEYAVKDLPKRNTKGKAHNMKLSVSDISRTDKCEICGKILNIKEQQNCRKFNTLNPLCTKHLNEWKTINFKYLE